MKVDLRYSDKRDLRENFQEYNSANELLAWYQFYSENQDSSFINGKDNSLGAAIFRVNGIETPASQINLSPYVGRQDLNSVSLSRESNSGLVVKNITSPVQWDVTTPFTIAMWARIPDTSSAANDDETLLLSKTERYNNYKSSRNDFFLRYKHSINRFEFQISGSSGGSPSHILVAGGATTSRTVEQDKWFHVAVVMENSSSLGSVAAIDNIKIYVNGLLKSTPGGPPAGTDVNTVTYVAGRSPSETVAGAGQSIPSGFTPSDRNGDLFIGQKFDSLPPIASVPGYYSDVLVHELAIWNKALKGEEIQSIWKSGVQRITSGIISESPRNILRTWDTATAYPYIKLPGDDRRLGNGIITYDDFSRTRVFQSDSRKLEVSYPFMIPKESPAGIGVRGAYASPNVPPDFQVVTGDGAVEYAEFRSAYDGTDTTFGLDKYQPFTDSRVDEIGEDDYFVIPITIGTTNRLTRLSTTASLLYGAETSTGVFYFSEDQNSFVRVGDKDPVTGIRIYTGSYFQTNPDNLAMASGMLSLFHAQDADPFRLHDGATTTLSASIASRYLTASFSNIGQPTNRYGGPANRRLYALQNNLFEMSRFINSPFVITSAKIVLSCSVEKNFDAEFTPGYPTDAYTVFMMRQAGPAAKGKPPARVVSSSYRELIAFRSILTYNESLKYRSIYTRETRSFTVLTSSISNRDDFAQIVNFGVDPTVKTTKVVPLTVSFDLTPRVAPTSLISSTVQQCCPPSIWGGSTSNIGQRYIINSTASYAPVGISVPITPLSIRPSVDQQEFQGFNADSQASSRMQFPFSPAEASYNPNEKLIINANTGHVSASYHITEKIENTESEYLLLPTDKLILGINTLHSSPDGEVLGSGGARRGFTFSTGSVLTLPPQEAKLVVRGKYIKNGEKYHTSLPQQITTAAVHESLHYDNPVLDQFEVGIRSEFAGSLRSLVISGSMTNPDAGWPRSSILEQENFRQVVDDGATPKAPGSDIVSVKRNLRISDESEVYYDSLVPDVKQLWRVDGFPLTASFSAGTLIEYYNISRGGAAPNPAQNNVWLHRFPFESRYDGIRRISREERTAENKSVLYNFSGQNSVFDVKFNAVRSSFTLYPANENFVEAVQRVNGTLEKNYGLGLAGTKSQPVVSTAGRNVVMFGIGDGPEGILLPDRAPRTVGSVTMFVTQKPRAFKYGLIDANPKPTSAVYRSTRYGQARDMLEQRQYTALFDYQSDFFPGLSNPTKSSYGLAKRPKVAKGRVSSTSAVVIKFRTPVHENPTLTEVSVSPLLTSGSNVSLYATSSLPYFDDDTPRNRSY